MRYVTESSDLCHWIVNLFGNYHFARSAPWGFGGSRALMPTFVRMGLRTAMSSKSRQRSDKSLTTWGGRSPYTQPQRNISMCNKEARGK
jgi:hypothetical protein